MRKIGTHYALGIALGILVFLVGYLLLTLIPGIGYGILMVLYVMILFAQGTFHGLTAVHGKAWSTISFIANFVLWTTELVQLDHLLEDFSIHRTLYQDHRWMIFCIGGFFWATNKLVLDFIIGRVLDKRREHAGTAEI